MARSIIVLLMALFVVQAWADGMMYPVAPTLQERPPSIPEQRAVLKWDGEVETMIVESTLAGPRGDYGWVVPLPARPSFVRAVKPDYVANTFAQVRPPVKPLPERDLTLPVVASLFGCTMLLTSALRYRKQEIGTRLLLFFGEALAGAVILTFVGMNADPTRAKSMGTAATAAGSVAKAIDVESLGTIGSYEVNVISGKDAGSLMQWLKAHRIRLPENVKPVIDAYAKEGWCFLAAEFRKDVDRSLPPHPLKAVFPSKTLIYPMRLTGTQDQPLRLEIVVVADRLAEIEGMEAWSCDDRDLLIQVGRDADLDREVYNDWKGSLFAMAKDGAVATYLRGDMTPDKMRNDYLVKWKPIERFQADVHDRSQAVAHAIWMSAVWMPLAAGFFGLVGIVFLAHAKVLLALGAILTFAFSGTVGSTWLGSVKTVETSR